MYIKRILLLMSILIVLALSYISYNIYQTVFSPNTTFQQASQSVFISKQDNMDSLLKKLSPVLKDVEGFYDVAKRKQYRLNLGILNF